MRWGSCRDREPTAGSREQANRACLNGRVTDPDVPATVDALVALGLSENEARSAVAEDRVALALVDKIVSGERSLPVEDVAAAAGVSAGLLRAWESALGLPSHDRYRNSDIEDARLLATLIQYLPDTQVEALVRPFRADGQALQRIAMAHLELVYRSFIQPMRQAGGDDVAVAIALAEVAKTLLPVAGPLVGTAYRRIMEHLLSTELVAQASRTAVDRMDLAVAFADVVGYTSLSARIDPDGLDEVIDAFETRCYTVAGQNERVQLVKFLGDAAMYVSTDPVALAGAMLDLVATAEHDSPLAGAPMRAGLAAGECLVRQGDYFGPPVNLAARLTDRARAGTLLAAPELLDPLGEHFALRRLPPIHLRGLGHQRPIAVRHPDDG